MITNFFIRLYFGMASLWNRLVGVMKNSPGMEANWGGTDGDETEEDLKLVVESIRQRVSLLRETVEEQSRLLHEDLDLIERLERKDASGETYELDESHNKTANDYTN